MSGSVVQVSGVPQVVAERLQSLCEKRGDLRERDVLNDARRKTSPLHAYFEWDDSVAAEAHRLTQAAALIRRVKVTVLRDEQSEPIAVRAYIARRELSSTVEDVEPGAYLPIERVAGQTAYEMTVMDSMRRDVLRLKRRYDNHESLFTIAREVFGGDEP